MLQRLVALAFAVCLVGSTVAQADYSPFLGVNYSHVEYTISGGSVPRPVAYDLVDIDPNAPGIGFVVTPSNGAGPLDTNRQTTREFVQDQGVQIAVNAHFFGPFDDTYNSGDPATLGGYAASRGDVYVPWVSSWNSINVRSDNTVDFLSADPGADAYNGVSGNYRLVRDGVGGTFNAPVNLIPDARTVFAVDNRGHILLLTVDGRNPTHSLGLSLNELTELLITQLHVVNAINLDGGGSSTMVFADGTPRVVNVPVGQGGVIGSERPVGSNFGVFARSVPEPGSIVLLGLGGGVLLVGGFRRSSRRSETRSA